MFFKVFLLFVIIFCKCNGQQRCNKSGVPPPDSECCGRDNEDMDKIIGGSETELAQYPWTVLVETSFRNSSGEAAFSCGGAVISNRYVLTAAHCLVQRGAAVVQVQVNLAEYDKRTFPNDCVTSIQEGQRCIQNLVLYAETIVTHPQYDDNKLENDIALIRLRQRAPYTESIRPICLPRADIDTPTSVKFNLLVAGWGLNGPYTSDVKQSTTVKLVPQNSCIKYYSMLTRRHLCAGSQTGQDTCKGDSGGPLMMVSEAKYFVVGIVSGKRADVPCGTAIPSLYTNVFHYVDWIRNNIRD